MTDIYIEEEKIDDSLWEDITKEEKENGEVLRPSNTFYKDAFISLSHNKYAVAGFLIILFMGLMAIFVPMISKVTYFEQNLDYYNIPMSFNISKISDHYVYVADGLRVIEVSKDGDILKLLEPAEDDIMTRTKVYEEFGTTFKLTYTKVVKLIDANDNEVINTEKVRNKTYKFGTDKLGRDMWVRIWYGGRISLSVALIIAFASMVIGILYGSVAAYVGGTVDQVMIRIVDVISSVPMTLYIILLMVALGPGFKTIIVAMVSVGWTGTSRMVRGEIKRIKSEDFVAVAKTIGVSNKRIILKHLIPNIIGPVVVILTFSIPDAIFTEAFLSFIGLGIPAPTPSWGTMCENGIEVFRTFPHQLFIPGGIISITVLAFNFLGDGFRDAFDPRLKK